MPKHILFKVIPQRVPFFSLCFAYYRVDVIYVIASPLFIFDMSLCALVSIHICAFNVMRLRQMLCKMTKM